MQAVLNATLDQLRQETDQLVACIQVSWSWELALIAVLVALLADRLLRPLWIRYTGRPYFLDR